MERQRLFTGVISAISRWAVARAGQRGAKYTISPRGNRATVGLPGAELFYTVHVAADRPMVAALVIGRAGDMPRRGFFDRAVALGRFLDDPAQHRTAWRGNVRPSSGHGLVETRVASLPCCNKREYWISNKRMAGDRRCSC